MSTFPDEWPASRSAAAAPGAPASARRAPAAPPASAGAPPAAHPAPAPRPKPARGDGRDAAHPAPPKPVERRFRQTVTKVDLWSVTKLALAFYVSAMAVLVVALVALWAIADAAGVIGSVESFIGDLVQSNDFHFLSAEVLRGAVLVALVLVALLIVLTIIAASFYNIFAELFGGLEITIKEEEPPAQY